MKTKNDGEKAGLKPASWLVLMGGSALLMVPSRDSEPLKFWMCQKSHHH